MTTLTHRFAGWHEGSSGNVSLLDSQRIDVKAGSIYIQGWSMDVEKNVKKNVNTV